MFWFGRTFKRWLNSLLIYKKHSDNSYIAEIEGTKLNKALILIRFNSYIIWLEK